jgi:single-stranded-DNA-specific exonuclease
MGVKNWKLSGTCTADAIAKIQQKHLLPRPIAVYFAARNITADEVSDFLEPRLANLSDPYRFPGIKDAAARLWDAILKNESILIHGDYDTDGITASALLAYVLRQNGAKVESFIPHRFDDGYGFTPESLEKAIDAFGPCGVLVTVDCGITSCEAVENATKAGIDVIVTDHHEAGPELPKALAIINAKVYPELEDLQVLSGAGTAFKLCHAFVKYGRENNLGGFRTKLDEILDYTALGTVADIVPLLGENRILVKYGIEILRRQQRPGIRALIESAKVNSELTPSDITFRLAPRINAAGRVGDANIALQLLESNQIVDAYGCASQLETFNRIRQEKEQEIYQEAKEQIERNLAWQSECALLVAGRDWHQGVIGIVASRLARDYNRPTIVLTIQGENAYGSGRSVSNVNLVEVLSKNAEYLERFGGHPMAVGVGLKVEQIAPFFEGINKDISQQINPADLVEYISYDGEITLDEITEEFFNYLTKLSPFGHSNNKPVFRFNNLKVVKSNSVGNGAHTRGIFQNKMHSIEFIAFNRPSKEFYGKYLDVLAVPQLNVHPSGNTVYQLNVVDFVDSF